MPEFEQWQASTPNWQKWKCKYYKGLGTSTAKEAKEYFSNMERHRIIFKYESIKDDLAIQLAFNSALSDDRKDWIKWHTEDINQRREQNLPMDYLYRTDTKQINFNDFVNKELVLFSKSSTERAIPSIMDGLKPGQRKIMFVCFTKNLIREIKVAQLAGKVAENSAYHHGEQSLTNTIIGLAQNFTGSNNINFLVPAGQFGTRLHGGSDAASARYIFTRLSSLALSLFNKYDEPLLTYLNEDGMRIEPEWYCPIIPTVLVNGANGVGTGYSTDIPAYNPLTLSNNMKYYIRQERERQNSTGEPNKYSDVLKLEELIPWYKNFTGDIKILENDRTRGVINGVCSKLDHTSIEITDLPIGTWTQQYKENVLETMLHPKRNDIAPTILDYKGKNRKFRIYFVFSIHSFCS
jgi:DNA topoisomerase-2